MYSIQQKNPIESNVKRNIQIHLQCITCINIMYLIHIKSHNIADTGQHLSFTLFSREWKGFFGLWIHLPADQTILLLDQIFFLLYVLKDNFKVVTRFHSALISHELNILSI